MAKKVTLAKHQDLGVPETDVFNIEDCAAPTEADLEEGSVVLTAAAFSVDPYQRRMIATGANEVGDTLAGFISGTVTASKNASWPVGARLGGSLPYQTVQILSAEKLKGVWKLPSDADLSLGVGILGMPGSTAYGGLIDILKPNEGETIWVSSAAGAVGSLVGQLAKTLYGCKVIGTAGGADKCKFVEETFGFDKCIDYRKAETAEDLEKLVREVAPEGIDMYFENVGGIHFDAACNLLRTYGRIAVCGGISMYNVAAEDRYRKFNPLQMIYSFQRIEGFMCRPWLMGQKGNFHQDMLKWWKEGKVRSEESVFEGIAKFGEANRSLYTGTNAGKVVIRL